jgi:hypothetical protein
LEIATLELTLADPVLRQADAAFGGAASPVSGSASADAIVARYGADLAARLDVRVTATAAVRERFLVDLQQAASSGNGVGWSLEHDPQSTLDDGSGVMRFDPAVFANRWAQGSRIEQRAFATLGLTNEAWSQSSQNNPNREASTFWRSSSGMQVTVGGQFGTHHKDMRWSADLAALDLRQPSELYHPSAIAFDPTLGWVTPNENFVHRVSTTEKVMGVVVVAGMTWATAGAFGVAGGAGVAAASTVTGAIASGAAFGAIGGLAHGNLELSGVLRGAFTGAVTAGVVKGSGIASLGAGQTAGSLGYYAMRALSITGQATLQGALQEITGGKFRDGFTAGLASGLGNEIAQSIDAQVKALGTSIDPAQAAALKQLGNLARGAVAILANPQDPAYAFASTFVNGLLGEVQKADAEAVAKAAQGTSGGTNGSSGGPGLDPGEPEPSNGQGARRTPESNPAEAAPGLQGLPGATTPDPAVQRIEITARALPRDAEGNRYELLQDGAVVVYRPDSSLLRIEPQQADVSGLAQELRALGAQAAGAGAIALPEAGSIRLPSLSSTLNVLRALGPVALVLIPGNQNEFVVELGAGQRFVGRVSSLYGQLQTYDSTTGRWASESARGMATGAGGFEVVKDDLRNPLPITTPAPPQAPSSPPPLPAWTDRPETTPGYVIDEPRPSSPGGYAGHPQDWRDLVTEQRNAENNRNTATDRHHANPGLQDPQTLAGKPEGGVGQWGYPQQSREIDKPAAKEYQEQVSGKPWGLEINVGGTHGSTASGVPSSTGGSWFDDVRVGPNGHVTLVDAKHWPGYVLPNQDWWVRDVGAQAQRQLDDMRAAGLDGQATIEWRVSTSEAAAAIDKALAVRFRDLPADRSVFNIVVEPKKGP